MVRFQDSSDVARHPGDHGSRDHSRIAFVSPASPVSTCPSDLPRPASAHHHSSYESHDRQRPQPNRSSYYYDPRTGRNARHDRRSWPPFPWAEDERASLSREANPLRTNWDDSDGTFRGSPDQVPVIIEVVPSEPNIKKQRSNGSDKKGRPNAPRFSGEFPGAPELNTRTPSTYAFTPKGRTPDPRDDSHSSHDSGYFSMSDLKSAVPTDKRRDQPSRSSAESDALRGQGKTRENGGSHHQRRSSGVPPFNGSSLSDTDRSVKSASSSTTTRPRLAELKKDVLNTARRESDSATTLPRPEFGSHASSKNASRSASPASSPVPRFPPSPPRSPKHSSSQSREDVSSRSNRSSAHSSVPSSVPSSRAGSRAPSPNRFDQEPLRRVPTIPAIPDDRTQRTSRLVSSQSAQDDVPTPKATPSSAASLPYPIDDMNLMPSEDDHRYKPRGLGIEEIPTPSIPGHRSTDKKAAEPSVPGSPQRPRPISRHTYSGEHKLPALTTVAAAAAATASPALSESPWSSGRGPRPPPPCPRPNPARGYDDWMTLDQVPDFDICPSCYKGNFADSPFHKSFKHARRNPNEKLRCDFSSPWIRLAWLLTIKQQRFDLDLVFNVARAGLKGSCPCDNSETRCWYTVKDAYSEKVDKFDVCITDVRRVEALLPSMHSLFTRAYHGQEKKRKCDFRIQSKRFQEYLDTLIEIDDIAHTRRKAPDYIRFANLARQKSQMRECTRDDLVMDVAWHFPPNLPEMTVCEECYSDVVWPAIAEGSSIAGKFSRTPQLMPRERRSSSTGTGTSCQLYSPRMRKVFKKAVQTSDFGYLTRRVQERKEVEQELQDRVASIRRTGASASQTEMQRLAEEWRKYE